MILKFFSSLIERQEAFFNGQDHLQLRGDMLQLDRVDPIGGDLVIERKRCNYNGIEC